MKTPAEKDELFFNAVVAIGDLVEATLNDTPSTTREKIAMSLSRGGELAVLCSLLGVPRFIGMLIRGPGAEPIRLFEIGQPSDALPRDTVSH